MKRSKFTKRIVAYIAAAAIVASTGFMGTSFYSNAETQYVVAESGARLRQEPVVSADNIRMKIPYGSSVEILDSQSDAEGNNWYKVRYYMNDTTYDEGWVSSSVMDSDSPGGTTTEEPDTPAPTPDPEPQQPDTQEPAPQQPDTQEPTDPEVDFTMPSAEISGDGYQSNGDMSFDVMGTTMTIGDFTDSQIPTGFARADIVYNSTNVKGLKCQFAEVYLVYLTDGENAGEFFVLDIQQNIVHSYVTIISGSSQLIVLVPPADAQIASSYGKTIYATDADTAVTAYQFNQSLDTTNAMTVVAEYYYLYGVSKNGILGWYLYDDVEKSYIRSTTDLSIELDSVEQVEQLPASEEDDSMEEMLVVVLGAICLIFIILTIIFGVRSARARKGLSKEEEYEEEDEDELNFIQRRKQERKYRHFMENFEEEGDEAWEHLLPEKERLPHQDKIVEQVDESGWKEKVEDEVDFDHSVSDEEDYDLTSENSEEDIKDFDDIENILLAGLEESVNELDKESNEEKTTDEKKKTSNDEWKDLEFLDV